MGRESCLIIAGEKSGENHCLSFYDDLVAKMPEVDFFGVGGDSLAGKGMEIMFHLKDFSSWGVTDVIAKIPFYLNARKQLLNEVKKRKCKVAILIDFQDFNLSLAKKLKKLGVNVLYYVAPQAWAWRPGRAKTLEENVHTLFSILPFEKDWFRQRGVSRIKGVIHPIMYAHKKDIEALPEKRFPDMDNDTLKIAILPGSRNFEVENLMPVFIQATNQLRERRKIETHLVCADSVKSEIYKGVENQVDVIHNSDNVIDVLKDVDFAIASSGTVTLMAALFQVPTIVCYKLSILNEIFYRLMVPYRGHISLANIVHQQEVFPELLQRDVTASNIVDSLSRWLDDKENYQNVRSLLKNTPQKISGDDFNVGDYIAEVIRESYGKN